MAPIDQQARRSSKQPKKIQLETLRYLNEGEGTLSELCRRYALKASRHKLFPELLQLRYSQIASPFEEQIPCECRGLILEEQERDQHPHYRVVAFPYKRFFNQEEKKYRDEIDWNTAKVYEKLDGSLCTLYYYKNEWHVASSGLPDASGKVKGQEGDLTFAKVFWNIWNEVLHYSLPTDRNHCYMFELITHHMPIIVPPLREAIILHGARNMKTLQEVSVESIAKDNNWECVQSFPLTSLEATVSAAKKFKPGESEGFVVCDAMFHRIKIKSPLYVALAHLSLYDKQNTNKRQTLKIVRENEGEEFLSYFPQWRPLYTSVKSSYEEFCNRLLYRSAQYYHNLNRSDVSRIARMDKALMAIAPDFFSQWIVTDRNLSIKKKKKKGGNRPYDEAEEPTKLKDEQEEQDEEQEQEQEQEELDLEQYELERRATLKQFLLKMDLGLLEKCMVTPHAEASNPYAYSSISGRVHPIEKREGEEVLTLGALQKGLRGETDTIEEDEGKRKGKKKGKKTKKKRSEEDEKRGTGSGRNNYLDTRNYNPYDWTETSEQAGSKNSRRKGKQPQAESEWEVVISRKGRKTRKQ